MEKPVCVQIKTAKALQQFHSDTSPQTVLAVAENAQFWPEIIAAKAAIDRGDIGVVLTARAKAWESALGEWSVDYAVGVSR